jgi:hypothetical protein
MRKQQSPSLASLNCTSNRFMALVAMLFGMVSAIQQMLLVNTIQTYYHYSHVPCPPLSSGTPSVDESIQIHNQTSMRSPVIRQTLPPSATTDVPITEPEAISTRAPAPVPLATSTKAPTGAARNPKFLFGIFSIKEDVERRQFMRDSVLSFYKDTHARNSTRICSLHDLLEAKVSMEDCQIAYVFVVGGLERGPTQMLTPNEENPISIPLPNHTEESDLVALNIQENMNDGKTPTYYKYASMMAEHLQNTTGSAFDFVTKMDLDTMLFPPNFLDFAKKNFPLGQDHVYAGKRVASMKISSWVSGALQILSPDLAKAITVPEAAGTLSKHEDVEISKRVEKFGKNVSFFWIRDTNILHQPSKTPNMRRPLRKAYDFTNILYGHTEWGERKFSRHTPGPFFKHLPTARKIWRHYLHWYTTYSQVSNPCNACHLAPPIISQQLISTLTFIYSVIFRRGTKRSSRQSIISIIFSTCRSSPIKTCSLQITITFIPTRILIHRQLFWRTISSYSFP